jgi:hypothetical protein
VTTPDAVDVGDITPHVAPEQPPPVNVQLIVCVSFISVPTKVCVPFTVTLELVGETDTPITTAAVTVIVVVADFVGSVIDVAVKVTVAGLGTPEGAVYVTGTPVCVVVTASVPQVAPLQPAPESAQVTP